MGFLAAVATVIAVVPATVVVVKSHRSGQQPPG
jgi:hypothetical protein